MRLTAQLQSLFADAEPPSRARSASRPHRVLFWYSSLTRAKALASCRYRIGNLVEVGAGATVVIAESLPRGALANVDVLVVARPFTSSALRRGLREAGERGILRLADFDDLLFSGNPADRPEVESGRLSLGWMQRAHREYERLLPAFDGYTVSTEELARELREVRPAASVHVVPNGLSRSWVAQGRALYPRWSPGAPRIVRFFPGSPTHDASFAAMAPALAAWLHAHPDVELELVGNLAWDRALFPAGRVRSRGAVPYDQLPELLASTWVNLWPRADTRFNRCKSAIKFFEAAAFGAPTIASRACAAGDLDCAGLVYASTPAEWAAALDRFCDDDVRSAASEACIRFVDARCGAERSWAALEDAIDACKRGHE